MRALALILLITGCSIADSNQPKYTVSASPNPFEAHNTLTIETSAYTTVWVCVYDAHGVMVADLGSQGGTRTIFTWNASGFASGVYEYHISIGAHQFTHKITKI